jgi:mono/diheme cytochrome c family protein
MRNESQKKILLGAFIASVTVAFVLLGPSKSSTASPAVNGNIERGKYLVEEVAKCPECHTPRDEKGNLQPEAWLQGASIWISPVKPIANWADRAPAIAGLPGFTDEEALRVLQKGTGPEGEVLRPPMHIYHMNQEDAKAIIAYLKSLQPPVH